MSKNRIVKKDAVLTAGAGPRRAVLCYESGLVYQYEEPENILAIYQQGKGWIVKEKPYYSSGGWGSGSSGDGQGHYLIEHAESMINAIGGRMYRFNSKEFLTQKELNELNQNIHENNRLIDAQNKIAERMGRDRNDEKLTPLETQKLYRIDSGQGRTAKGVDPIKTSEKYDKSVEVFLNQKGKAIRVDEYVIHPNKVLQGSTVVAFRDANNNVFMNSQLLKVSNFESKFMGGQSMIQKSIREIAKYSIPFNVLAAAKLKLNETKILEQGPESTLQIKVGGYYGRQEERHFTGALLLENDGRKFLMDIDREEIKHGLFNAFFVEVESWVKTIEEAYESMKPKEVRAAEKEGLKVLRQGEWFFIETDKELKILSEKVIDWDREKKQTKVILRHNVSHGKGRPNSLYKPVGFGDLDNYVCGTVSHSGREHRDLDLGQKEVTSSGNGDYTTFKLWKLVGNTTVSNFTIEGDID